MLISAGLLVASGLAVGAGSHAASAQSPAPNAPTEVFVNAQNVSNDGWYSNTPSIAASPLNGAVTVVWEQRDDPGGTFGAIQQNSNLTLNGVFRGPQQIDHVDRSKNDGNPATASDSLGRRHIVYWSLHGDTCGYYSRVDADGAARVNDRIPGGCTDVSNGRKNVAMAVGPDNSVHVLLGRNAENIYYWHMTAAGVWDVVGQALPAGAFPKDIAIRVSTQGVVMASWVATTGGRGDVLTSVRLPNGNWDTVQNISAVVNPAGSAHGPAMGAAPDGGIRIAWTMIKTDPFTDPGYDDLYYREWVPGTGWTNQPVARLTNSGGSDYLPAIAVDYAGMSHIVWGADTTSQRGFFRLQYVKGRISTGFTYGGQVLPQQFGGAFQKEASIDVNPPTALAPAYVHVAFGSNLSGSQKDNFYTLAGVIGTPLVTPTPTASPTPCSPGNYSDVHQSDYFYVPAQQLGQLGIMNGYADCTFRPFNNITRAQAAKIIVLGSDRQLNTAGGPHFTDVPTSNTFYSYIETAYNGGIISGYSDGTFRPNANITRGQFSKVVIIAFGFTLNTQGGPHFTDVPTSNPFYAFIETSRYLGLISGYSDGTFRPGLDITRGQAAKITFQARQQAPASTETSTATSTPGEATETATSTAVVVTATPSDTPVVVTATYTNTPIVVTATATETGSPTVTVTSTALALP